MAMDRRAREQGAVDDARVHCFWVLSFDDGGSG